MPDASSTVSIAVLAGLLSFLPVTILFWAYYLRERSPSVPGRVITRFFAVGMLTVLPALLAERGVFRASAEVSPLAASVLFANVVALDSPWDLLRVVVVAFGIVALFEEGFRFLFLRFLVRRSAELDQLIDGLQVGVASGIGFAFIENSLYFLRLFQLQEFDTLAVVFFLRFLISTFGHIVFGGIMGYELGRAVAEPLERRRHLALAFLLPWLFHGVFDALLTIQLSSYAVLLLLPPLFYLWARYRAPELRLRYRLHGRLLQAPVRGSSRPLLPWRRRPLEALPTIPWCPTCLSPLDHLGQSVEVGGVPEDAPQARTLCSVCGTRFTSKPLPSRFPARVSHAR